MVVSYFLFYRAVIATTLIAPYETLFADVVRSAAALRSSERTTHAVLAAIPDTMFRLDADGIYAPYRWAGSEEGARPAPVTPRPLTEAFSPATAERLMEAARQAVERHETRFVEYEAVEADGSRRDYECRIVPSASDEVLGLIRDITAQKSAETALRVSERKFRSLFDTSHDGLVLTDLEGHFLDANPAFAEMVGYSLQELRGMTFRQITPEPWITPGPEVIEEQAGGGEGAALYEKEYTRKDGTVFPVVVSAWVVRDAEGAPARVWKIIRDTTDRKRAEEAMRLASVGQLAAGVAHEFRNILAVMAGRAQMAQRHQTRESYGKLVDAVLAASERGARVVEGLTRFAVPHEPVRQLTPIELPLETALLLAGREMENQQVTLVRDYRATEELVWAEIGELQDVFLALIINACQAMPDGGVLTATTTVESDKEGRPQAVARLADTGVGIAPADLPRIFDPFYTTKGRLGASDVPGTGLGLSAAHGIISAHGGTISATSHLGEGACFEVRLAAHTPGAEAPGEEPAAAGEPERGPQTGRAVLFVDDEEALRAIVHELLVSEGHDVVTAEDTDEALAQLAARRFDAVIADLMMPGAGGEAVLAAARELDPPPPVIVVTGKAEDGLFTRLQAAGAAACFSKPFALQDLLDTLNRLLAR